MAICGCPGQTSRYAIALLAGTVLMSVQVLAAQPAATTAQPGVNQPAHNTIQCPYIPTELDVVATCGGKPATCVGTDGHDVIVGTDGDDVIVAGFGNDVVHGDLGDDIICGGPGNDSLIGVAGEDSLFGGPGNDRLHGGVDADHMHGGSGDHDVLWGGPGLDYLDGGEGSHDICMLQREMGDLNPGGCNTIYPPPGYLHADEPDPGVLKAAEPLKLRKKTEQLK